MDYEFQLKVLGSIVLTIIVGLSCWVTIKAPIDKFGGGPEHSEQANKDIVEMKKRSLFKLLGNNYIIIIIVIALIGNMVIPKVFSDQIALVIVIAGITSLGIKIGSELRK